MVITSFPTWPRAEVTVFLSRFDSAAEVVDEAAAGERGEVSAGEGGAEIDGFEVQTGAEVGVGANTDPLSASTDSQKAETATKLMAEIPSTEKFRKKKKLFLNFTETLWPKLWKMKRTKNKKLRLSPEFFAFTEFLCENWGIRRVGLRGLHS